MVLASGRDDAVSFKKAVNVCRAIKGLKLEQAKEFLKKVIDEKAPVQFTKYRSGVAHRRSLGGPGGAAGRYPRKSSMAVLKVLENAENNASMKNFQTSSLLVVHAAAQKARVVPRSYPRAFGRMSTKRKILTHIEVGLKEVRE
jgi:large subunit ribosomal protein L22